MASVRSSVSAPSEGRSVGGHAGLVDPGSASILSATPGSFSFKKTKNSSVVMEVKAKRSMYSRTNLSIALAAGRLLEERHNRNPFHRGPASRRHRDRYPEIGPELREGRGHAKAVEVVLKAARPIVAASDNASVPCSAS